MKNSISKKLAAGFGLCILLMLMMVGFNFTALQRLDRLYLETLKRTEAMTQAADAQHIGGDLYTIIANAVINRNLDKSTREWVAGKSESRAALEKVAAAADTPGENAKVREAQEAYEEIIRIFEKEMLPLIQKGGVIPGPLGDVDARIDRQIVLIDSALRQVAETMRSENQRALREFNTVIARIIQFGLALSLFGVAVALMVTYLTTRRIVLPLAEITGAALEMEKGNYHVDLKYKSTDEIGILAATFRDMSMQIEKCMAAFHESNKNLQLEIGERKMAEEEVQRLNADLEQRVMKQTAELVKINKELLRMVVEQKRAGMELTSSQEELRNLTQYLQTVREEERTTIAREIHDELGQLLTALKMDVAWLSGKLPAGHLPLVNKALEMTSLIDETIKSVQRISAELRAGLLDGLDLSAAIESQIQELRTRTGILFTFENSLDCETLDRSRSTALFRIFQEALTNICRHADATQVLLTLLKKGNEVVASVTDNGKGISEMKISDPKSLGLIGMRERVRYFGGELSIMHIPDGGTAVRVKIPIDESDKDNYDDQGSNS